MINEPMHELYGIPVYVDRLAINQMVGIDLIIQS